MSYHNLGAAFFNYGIDSTTQPASTTQAVATTAKPTPFEQAAERLGTQRSTGPVIRTGVIPGRPGIPGQIRAILRPVSDDIKDIASQGAGGISKFLIPGAIGLALVAVAFTVMKKKSAVAA